MMTMAAMIGCGAALGFLFDGYRVAWAELKLPRRLHPPFDLLYWLLAAPVVFRTLYLVNGGELRFYVFLSLLLGVSAYFALLGGACRFIVSRTVRFVLSVFRFLRGLLLSVFRIFRRLAGVLIVGPLTGMYRGFRALFGIFARVSIFLGKLVIQWLYYMFGKLRKRK